MKAAAVVLKVEARFLDSKGETIHIQTASGKLDPRAPYQLMFDDNGKIAVIRTPY